MDKAITISSTGTGAVFFGSMTSNDIAVLGGLVLTVMTFGVNFYYKRQHFKLQKERALDGNQ